MAMSLGVHVHRMEFIYEPRHDKTNNVAVRPAKTQISLGIRPVWSESSLCAQWVAKGPSFLHVDSEDSDQTGRMPRLIWVFAGRTLTLFVLSCRGSYLNLFVSQVSDFSCRNKALIPELLKQGYRYQKPRTAFSKFNRRLSGLVEAH